MAVVSPSTNLYMLHRGRRSDRPLRTKHPYQRMETASERVASATDTSGREIAIQWHRYGNY